MHDFAFDYVIIGNKTATSLVASLVLRQLKCYHPIRLKVLTVKEYFMLLFTFLVTFKCLLIEM